MLWSCMLSGDTQFQFVLLMMFTLITWLRQCLIGISTIELLFFHFYLISILWGKYFKHPLPYLNFQINHSFIAVWIYELLFLQWVIIPLLSWILMLQHNFTSGWSFRLTSVSFYMSSSFFQHFLVPQAIPGSSCISPNLELAISPRSPYFFFFIENIIQKPISKCYSCLLLLECHCFYILTLLWQKPGFHYPI